MSYNKVLPTGANSRFSAVHNKIQRLVSLSGDLAGKPQRAFLIHGLFITQSD